MEEYAEKVKELQNMEEKHMNMSPPPGNAGPVIMSIEEKMDADARSMLPTWTIVQQQQS